MGEMVRGAWREGSTMGGDEESVTGKLRDFIEGSLTSLLAVGNAMEEDMIWMDGSGTSGNLDLYL